MATLSVVDLTEAGVAGPATAAASGGDQFLNDGNVMLAVENAHASASRTVTITAQTTSFAAPGGGATTKSDAGGTVAALSTRLFGPFPKAAFNDASGYAQVSYSDSGADLAVGVYRTRGIA